MKDNPSSATSTAKSDPSDVEFFEKKVRPILITRCQGCHGADKQKGGLRLDARATVLAGGSTGPAVVPGNPKESLLVDAINYGETYQMPPKSKLPPEEIATLTEWVQRGAPWGVDGSCIRRNHPLPPGFPVPSRKRNSRHGLGTGASSRCGRFRLPQCLLPNRAGCATRSTASSWPRSKQGN